MTAIPFPDLPPTGRSYNPGAYPQTVFEAQNGTTTVVRYGSRRVNSELTLEFRGINTVDANSILRHYEKVNGVWDYVTFTELNGSIGTGARLRQYYEESQSGLRWRYAEPPSVQSLVNNRVTVQCRFIGYLDPD